ncbi:NmrA family NAD(P)-binding protein [Microbacterium sp. Leaf320]|uniref:NmrA family NAD(P)-binding protein n=1 Tax=Microbacterium sp. Leaf320 TaxID=1736334 RepID=UPI0006FEEA3D|nr:NmrA family NAD(P)-binding protein [Microbacterium sp. Leaf320]KQQ62564.1 hypothetical protein ASF63_18655 [Microbacterium sp. Leaf320]
MPHYRVEKYLEAVGAPFTFLRPNFFMQNLSTTYREDIRDRDEIYLPAGRAFRTIRYARPSEDDYLARIAANGAPGDYVAMQRMIYRVVRFNISAFQNRSVRRLTGRPARRFREFAERERAAWER